MPDMENVENQKVFEKRIDIAKEVAVATNRLIESAEKNIPGAKKSIGWRDTFAESVGGLLIHKEELGNIDELTRIPNRRALFQKIDQEIKRAKRFNHPLSVLMMDLDGFKKVNDGFGHTEGDAALKQTAKILSENVRDSDFVGRFGGDEFVIISPQTETDQVLILADRLREKIENHFTNYRLSACFGLAVLRENNATSDLIFKQADEAMYLVKNNGKNGVGFKDSEGKLKVLQQKAVK